VTGDRRLICVVEAPRGTRNDYEYDAAVVGILSAVAALAL
jgi:hypothetical protein